LCGVGLFCGEYIRYALGLVAINAMVVLSLDVLLGRLGLISIGHAGFVAIGAYTSAVLQQAGWPFLLTIPAAGGLATLCGILLGLPSMRLAGFYLAIATLAFGSVIEQLIRWMTPITGGVFGLAVNTPTFFGLTLDSAGYFALLCVALAIFIVAAERLSASVAGRAMQALKTSEPAAESIGINLVGTKLLGFAISGFGAGVAGALYGPLVGFLGPEHFTFMASVSYVAMSVLGGAGTLGSLLGAAVVTAVPEVFAGLQDYSSLIWGVAMLLILLVSPAGLSHVNLRRFRLSHRAAP
jgi:ABC-type branched-subunit amino acid transport system permease subunit